MRCPKCGKDVEFQNKQVGVDENGKPIFNEYAICRGCKKQWNLDKQKGKKAAIANASNHTQVKESAHAKMPKASGTRPVSPTPSKPTDKNAEKTPIPGRKPETPVRKLAVPQKEQDSTVDSRVSPKESTVPDHSKASMKNSEAASHAKAPLKYAAAANRSGTSPIKPGDNSASESKKKHTVPLPTTSADESAAKSAGNRHAPKKRQHPANTGSRRPAEEEGQRYGNIPSEKVRVKREKAVKSSYEDMLAADHNKKPGKKKRPVSEEQAAVKKGSIPSGGVQKKKSSAQRVKQPPIKKEEPKPEFYMARIILGIISIIAFAFFAYKGFLAGLSNISAGTKSTTGTVYIVLALCMLVSGLLLLIMRRKHTIFAFILPLVFYIGGAAFAFLKRSNDGFLLYGAIASAVLVVIFLVLAILSRRGNGDRYEDDYEDPFEEDHDNY